MRNSRLRRCRAVTAAAVTVLLALVPAATAAAGEIRANPATFPAAFASAAPGDTIVLETGDYGRFAGAMKPGEVVIRPAPGATATMELSLRPAAHLTFDGLRFSEIELADERTSNIVVRNSTITGQTVFRTGELANANILFDRNVHAAWDVCEGCAEGRVWLPQQRPEPSGITIQNSRFGPGGDSDGIQNGSNGTRILSNEFVGIKQIDGGLAHADSIQLYGSKNTVVAGNWFHDVSVGIMAPDGAERERIEDNVFQATSPYAIQLGSDDGSIIRHNTFPDGACEYDKRCGIISLGHKPGNPPSRGTVIKDNILAEISWQGTTVQEEDHNLFAVTNGRGPNDLKGLPTYAGGPKPTTYQGFALAPGSLGKGTASDGLDRGARIDPAAPPPPAGAPAAPAPGQAGPRVRRPRLRVLTGRRALRRKGRIRIAVRSRSAGTVALAARIRPRRGARARPVRPRRVVLRFARAGARRTVTLRVSRDARRRLARGRRPVLVVRAFAGPRGRRPIGRSVLAIRR